MAKTIALLGGSFNPPQIAHFQMGDYIHKSLGVDEVWMMFSVNRFKDQSGYVDVAHRKAMGEILARYFPDTPFVMCDIEDQLKDTGVDTQQSYYVMKELTRQHQDIKFVWVMGADNLNGFHNWSHADEFINEFPIAVLDRPLKDDEKDPAESVTARRYADIKAPNAASLKENGRGWIFLDDNPKTDMSSTKIREAIATGEARHIEGPMKEIIDYIYAHNLDQKYIETVSKSKQTTGPVLKP